MCLDKAELQLLWNQKFHAANVSKISLGLNTVRQAREKEFCSHSTILSIKL